MTEEKRLSDRLYYHWSFPVLCIYSFVGILGAMIYGMMAFGPSAEPYYFRLAIVLGFTSVFAGMYCKFVDDSSSGFQVKKYIESVPDDRKDMARDMFPKRYWK